MCEVNKQEKEAREICFLSFFLYSAINIMPVTTVLSFIIIKSFENESLFAIILGFFYMARTFSTYLLSSEKITIEKYYNSLKKINFAILFLPVGYFLVYFEINNIIGTVLFIIGLIGYGFWEGEGLMVRFSLYRNTSEVREHTYKEQSYFEISRLISLIISFFFIFLNIEEYLKIQIILTLVFISSSFEVFYLKFKVKINSNQKFKRDYKERFINFIKETKKVKMFSKNAKVYLIATLIANIAGVGLVYIVAYSRDTLNISFTDILKIKVFSSVLSYLLVIIKTKFSIKRTPKYYVSIGRFLTAIALILVVFANQIYILYIAFLLNTIGTMFLNIGKKIIIDILDFGETKNNQSFAYIRLLQGVFAAVMFFVAGTLTENGVDIKTLLIFGGIGFGISSILTMFFIKIDDNRGGIKNV